MPIRRRASCSTSSSIWTLGRFLGADHGTYPHQGGTDLNSSPASNPNGPRKPVQSFEPCCLTRSGSFTCDGAAKDAGFRSATSISGCLMRIHKLSGAGRDHSLSGRRQRNRNPAVLWQCRFASKAGQLAGNHFLTIIEGLENVRPLGRARIVARRSGHFVRSALAPNGRLPEFEHAFASGAYGMLFA